MLAGITVLDLSSVGPGSRCSWLLADLGAEVVKVVAPASRGRIDPPAHTYGAGRGTRRVEIDLKEDPGSFLDLVASADVVVESYRPGVADRLGIGYEACAERNPRIVYAAVTGYGQTGPCASWAGHDLNYLAVGGYLAAQNNALPGATVADSAGGGMQAAMSILAALLRRERTGEGAYLDVSTLDGVLYLMALQIDEYLATGARSTLLNGGYACYDVYPCKDGKWISVGAIEERFFANLCRALGLESLAEAQYDDSRQEEVRAALRAAFALRDRDEWVAELAPQDTCVAPVLDVSEVPGHPHVRTQRAPGHDFDQLAPTIARSIMTVSGGRGGVRGGTGREAPGAPPDGKDWVGQERTDPPGDIVCERGYILHWLEATENANPMYWDESCQIAPPSMISTWMRPLQFVPGRERTWMPLSMHFDLKEAFGLPDGVVAANEITFYEPVRLGDRITTTQKVLDVSDEKTTRLGTGRFWTIEVTHGNQDGEVKAVETYEMFSYAGGFGGGTSGASGPPDQKGLGVSTPADDVDSLPPLEVKVLARHVVMGASSSRDWQPQHHDTHWAVEKVKVKDIFLNTPNQAGWIERYLTDWSGPKGRLGRLRFKMRRSVCAGEVMRFDATVTNVTTDDSGCLWAELDVRLTVEGEPATECSARIALPASDDDDPWQRRGDDWRP